MANVKRMSASPADRFSERLETALSTPRSRRELVAALEAAEAADAANEKADYDEETAAKIERDETAYARALRRVAAAERAVWERTHNRTPLSDIAKQALRNSITDEQRAVLHALYRDTSKEIESCNFTGPVSESRRQKLNSRANALREFQKTILDMDLAEDPIAAANAARRKFQIPESPRPSRDEDESPTQTELVFA